MKNSPLLLLLVLPLSSLLGDDLPTSYDLRNVSGKKYVSAVKNQQGGTCWTHGTMAALESNLLKTGVWAAGGESGEPNLAEYHLDWWNGFNRHFNGDITPSAGGLTVHEGGDYRVAAAYLARGGGAVREQDGQSYNQAPSEQTASYHVYYVRDIDWLATGDDNGIPRIKKALMEHGAVGTALDWDESFYSGNTFYQPANDSGSPNHSVTIVGWDDHKQTEASQPGAWLVKNSWGPGWGSNGYFWLSYADKTAGRHPQMGAVSFNGVERLHYQHIYYYDYHGWRDTKANVTEAFNAYTAQGNPKGLEEITAVSFYVNADNAPYLAKIYRTFENGELKDEAASVSGTVEYAGFHTVDLGSAVELEAGQKFYVYLQLPQGGQPYDKTSDVPVLLGSRARVMVKSSAHAGESFYKSGNAWVDLNKDDATANFCMKALTQYW